MPLITCPDCERQHSDAAPSCIHCGRPSSNQKTEDPAFGRLRDAAKANAAMVIGFSGAVVLFIGPMLAPIVRIPIFGGQTYFDVHFEEVYLLMVAATISAIFAFTHVFRGLWFTGTACLLILLFTAANVTALKEEIRAELRQSLAGNPFADLGAASANMIRFDWGAAVFLIGTLCIFLAAHIAPRPSPKTMPVKKANRRSRRF